VEGTGRGAGECPGREGKSRDGDEEWFHA
jgi:hypothetical protein